MPGTSTGATFVPPPPPIDGAADTILVALYDRTAQKYAMLDNVECLRVENHEGAIPSSARFRYALQTPDPTQTDNPPSQFEQIWPLTATTGATAGVVALGAELGVIAVDPEAEDENGDPVMTLIFDGFADAPQVDLGPRSQHVTFTASGAPVRCWDNVLPGQLMRDATNPQTGAVVQTELQTRFNPDGEPNCTPDSFDVNVGTPDPDYPVFLDPSIARDPDPRTRWNLGKFARYLFYTRSASDLTYVNNYVSNYPGGIDDELTALTPTGGPNANINVADPSTYTTLPIYLRDLVADSRPWPEPLAQEIGKNGFAFRFTLTADDALNPINGCDIYRKDGLGEAPPKQIYLPVSGTSPLDPSQCNTGMLSLVRDAHGAANQFNVISRLGRYEISVVLACGFTPSTADTSSAAALGAFKTAQIAGASDSIRKKYRWFVADEAGDGHYNFTTSSFVTATALDLTGVLGKPDPTTGIPKYVPRLRPGADKLFYLDDAGNPYRSELAISVDYAGAYPAIWDGTGTWQSCGHSGWRSLGDRLGIEITSDNPNGWSIPDTQPTGGSIIPGNVVKIVERLASSTPQLFFLRYTTVIEGDVGVVAQAPMRTVSPLGFTVSRRIDARDTFDLNVIDPSSYLFKKLGPPAEKPTDDSDPAKAQAESLRRINEFPAVSGSVTIPWFSLAYDVGDRLSQIVGRNVDLRANATATGESPFYPSIVGRTWDFEGKQGTTLLLSDRRAETARAAEDFRELRHAKHKPAGR